jgi:hypothetical protein
MQFAAPQVGASDDEYQAVCARLDSALSSLQRVQVGVKKAGNRLGSALSSFQRVQVGVEKAGNRFDALAEDDERDGGEPWKVVRKAGHGKNKKKKK